MGLASTPWPKHRRFNHNNAIAGTAYRTVPITWQSTVFAPQQIAAPPVIGTDGTIYLTSEDGTLAYLVAINPDGSLKWRTQIFDMFGNPVRYLECSPAIGDDNKIYITDSMYSLLAFNTAGELVWRYDHDNGTAGCVFAGVAIGEHVYFCENGNTNYQDHVIAVSMSGNFVWRCNTGHCGPYGANVALADGYIYVAGQYQYIAPTGAYLSKVTTSGSLVWSVRISDSAELYTPVVVGSQIYVLDDNDVLYVVNNADGAIAWSKTDCFGWKNSAVVDADGTVYVGGKNTNVQAYHPDGSLKWEYVDTQNPRWCVSGVVLDSTGNVLCLTDETALYVIDSNGNLVHREVYNVYTYEMNPVFGQSDLYVPFYDVLYCHHLAVAVKAPYRISRVNPIVLGMMSGAVA